MSTHRPPAAPDSGHTRTPRHQRTGERVELIRYTISAGERIVCGQRICGIVRLTDIPADGPGRAYLIERELTAMDEIRGILADYLEQADRWDAVPADVCCLDLPEVA